VSGFLIGAAVVLAGTIGVLALSILFGREDASSSPPTHRTYLTRGGLPCYVPQNGSGFVLVPLDHFLRHFPDAASGPVRPESEKP
jgi:hypothetical protein